MPAPGRREPDGRVRQTSDEVSTGPGADPSGDVAGSVSARVAPSSPFQPLNRWSVKHPFGMGRSVPSSTCEDTLVFIIGSVIPSGTTAQSGGPP
jgi:hypothetical protein